jgi:hypothetical protein
MARKMNAIHIGRPWANFEGGCYLRKIKIPDGNWPLRNKNFEKPERFPEDEGFFYGWFY